LTSRWFSWGKPNLMPLGLAKIPEDRFFAQCLARLEPVQAVHEDETLAIAHDQDLGRLPDLEPLSHFPTCPDHISELPGWTETNLASSCLTLISSNQPPQVSGAAARKMECDC